MSSANILNSQLLENCPERKYSTGCESDVSLFFFSFYFLMLIYLSYFNCDACNIIFYFLYIFKLVIDSVVEFHFMLKLQSM